MYEKSTAPVAQHASMTATISGFTLTALSVVFGSQMLRVFLPFLQNLLAERLHAGAMQVLVIALLVFASSLMVGPLNSLLGLRRSLLIAAGGTGLMRLGMQLWHGDPTGDMFLVITGLVFYFWCFPLFFATFRSQQEGQNKHLLACGILFGFALDVALNGVFLTYDYIWQNGAAALVVAFILFVLQWTALRNVLSALPAPNSKVLLAGVGFRHSLLWLALGMILFLELMIFQNVAHFVALTDWLFPIAFLWVLVCHIFGLMLFVGMKPNGVAWLSGMGLVLLPLFPWTGNPDSFITAMVFFFGQGILAYLTRLIFDALFMAPIRPGLKQLTLAHGLSMMLVIILIYAFYITLSLPVFYQNYWLFGLAGAVVTACALGASAIIFKREKRSPARMPHLIKLTLVLLAFPAFTFLSWQPPTPTTSEGHSVRIFDYNIHNGFNTMGHLDMEMLAELIEAQKADIVTLQEVSRGWPLLGSVDMLSWLSQRLQMPYAFTPSHDPLWGHAVLSRLPILASETHTLPPENLLLRRSFSYQKIDAGGTEPLNLINTHFHAGRSGGDIRVMQTQAIVEFLQARAITDVVISGDLNATPDSPEIKALFAHGLSEAILSTGSGPGFTFTSKNPVKKIDYILFSPEFSATDASTIHSNASDHFGVVATLDRKY